MIDPIVSLAFSIYSNPGVYALLLGSGLSRSAGIPTGWEIVLDLIRKVATLEGTSAEPNPEEWYRSVHQTEADYSEILDRLVKTPSERSQVLRPYFEPTDEEREQGIKVPTAAHRAIAELMKAGYIRVVLTTNFDRLLETALADVGLQPTVISSADTVMGALPLVHAQCLIVKINGDYLDTRIKNTGLELAQYDPALNGLLDRLFDDFGFLVCGWSGESDIALRGAIERCPNRRFSMYWTALGEPSATVKDLIQHRAAVTLRIQGADQFFQRLKDKVFALHKLDQPHPLSAKIAAAQVKRYIVRPEDRIALHDLVHEETERAYAALNADRFHSQSAADDAVEVGERLKLYNSLAEVPLTIIISGCYWGQEEHEYLWQGMLKRLGDPPVLRSGIVSWIDFHRYPASLLMYGAGIAALGGQQFGNLAVALKTPIKGRWSDETKLAAVRLNVVSVVGSGSYKLIPGKQNPITGYSDNLIEVLREPCRSIFSVDSDYVDTFDMFEYFLGVVGHAITGAGPIGRAAWTARQMFTTEGPTNANEPSIRAVASVLFPKGVEEYEAVKTEYDQRVITEAHRWF